MSLALLEKFLNESREIAKEGSSYSFATAFGYLETAVESFINEYEGGDEYGKQKNVKE